MVRPLSPAGISAWSWVNALGAGCSLDGGLCTTKPLSQALTGSGLTSHAEQLGISGYSGRVSLPLTSPPPALQKSDSRSVRLLLTCLAPLKDLMHQHRSRVGPKRIGLVIGSSTGGIDRTEEALLEERRHHQRPSDYDFDRCHPYHALLDVLRAELDCTGPGLVISTACASGGKALATAQRWLHAGVVDVVLAGGVDALCELTVRGFAGLGVLSPDPCSPFSKERAGISIGEGAALLILEKSADGEMFLLGAGESNDAHHPTAPHPEGVGAILSMERCLQVASVAASEVSYVNAHGTGTQKNDAMEALAMKSVLGSGACFSSTKHKTGHQLGAAGATEAVFCLEALSEGVLPPQTPAAKDSDLSLSPFVGGSTQTPQTILSSSFAFGGSNVTVCLSKRKPSHEARSVFVLPSVFVRKVALWTPHFGDVSALTSPARPEPVALPPAELLPLRARGRASVLTRLFAELFTQLRGSSEAPNFATAEIATVFASGYGELTTTMDLLRQIATEPTLSPLKFQASVHNTAAGQITLTTENRSFSTSLAAGQSTFSMGLLEAQTWLSCHGGDIVLLAADEASPDLLRTRLFSPLGVGLLLSSHAPADGAGARLSQVRCAQTEQEWSPRWAREHAELLSIRESPIAWGLPLLDALEASTEGPVAVGPHETVVLG